MLPWEYDWRTVLGKNEINLEMEYTITNAELLPSQYVQARFRCMNAIGWSEWGADQWLLMAGVPEAPPKPSYISSTATTITVQLYES